ncbi:hypothetical protein, partial [Aquimarina addita]|uniref:hypothetical protein n=1 Tax=Aquimarina addita TaxID=870485 RepID=UPI0031EBFA28
MNFLRHIFLILSFLGFYSKNLKAESIVIGNDKIKSFSKQDFKEVSAEKEWLALCCFQEESTNQEQLSYLQFPSENLTQNFLGEVCLKSVSKNLISHFQFGGNLENYLENGGWVGTVFIESSKLVDSWKVLNDAGVDDVLRRNLDELELVGKNIDEIKKAGGYKAWKIS